MKLLIIIMAVCFSSLTLYGMNKGETRVGKVKITPSIEEMSTVLLTVALEANDPSLLATSIQNGADFRSIISSGNIEGIKYLLAQNLIDPQTVLPNSYETPIHYFESRYSGKNKEEILALLKNYKKKCLTISGQQ
ncbi:MAG: hypothetical protein BWY54_00413 [Candidatus Dependentiae bacterium ADurb.Bin331]|nr:MAG: hypothetical protein BWY54_00413 [Candidatus Dependentiae bacterium ADurb.Bin331]